jgi:hypothetical protein
MEHDHSTEHQAETRSPGAPPAARSAGGAFGSILGLQRSAGNRATDLYLRRMTDRVARVSLQRDDLDGLGGDAAEPLDTAPAPAAGTFSDKVNVSTSEVPIVVRNNAFDFVNAVQAKFGGDGGRCTVSPTSFTPDVDASGRVSGAHLIWNVTVLVPTVQADATGPISKPEAAAELAACRALAARIREHEAKHAAIEVAGRANFAVTLKGKLEKAIDPALGGLGKAVGKKQRALDNAEGVITLDSNNNVIVSGKDHPEYEADGAS